MYFYQFLQSEWRNTREVNTPGQVATPLKLYATDRRLVKFS